MIFRNEVWLPDLPLRGFKGVNVTDPSLNRSPRRSAMAVSKVLRRVRSVSS